MKDKEERNEFKGNNLAISRRMNGKLDMDTISERKKSRNDLSYLEIEINQLKNRERELETELN